MGASEHPRVTTRVTRTRPRYRELVDLTHSPKSDMPAARSGALVKIEVGAGLSAQELPKLAVVAAQVRGARRVEIVGSTQAACDEARHALLALWAQPVPTAPETGLGNWADLLISYAAPPLS